MPQPYELSSEDETQPITPGLTLLSSDTDEDEVRDISTHSVVPEPVPPSSLDPEDNIEEEELLKTSKQLLFFFLLKYAAIILASLLIAAAIAAVIVYAFPVALTGVFAAMAAHKAFVAIASMIFTGILGLFAIRDTYNYTKRVNNTLVIFPEATLEADAKKTHEDISLDSPNNGNDPSPDNSRNSDNTVYSSPKEVDSPTSDILEVEYKVNDQDLDLSNVYDLNPGLLVLQGKITPTKSSYTAHSTISDFIRSSQMQVDSTAANAQAKNEQPEIQPQNNSVFQSPVVRVSPSSRRP